MKTRVVLAQKGGQRDFSSVLMPGPLVDRWRRLSAD